LVAVFFVLVKPLLNALKNMPKETFAGIKELPANMQPNMLQLPGGNTPGKREKVLEMGRSNPEKAEQLIRGWISE
ncbi:MAG: hypothetical protein Q8M56_19440, partial [Desulfobacterales bacterium]|nr:hypothetical protein [Desulfobacterales bacterium]